MELKEQQKLLYLERILKLYVRFLRAYSDVTVEVVSRKKRLRNIMEVDEYTGKEVVKELVVDSIKPTDMVKITYFGTRFDFYNHQTIEFPMSHLPKRIAHYKRKLLTAFKNRHGKQNV